MIKITNLFSKIRFIPTNIPLFLLVASGLAFGIISPFLGFYQDDWHFVYYYVTRGLPGLVEIFIYDGHPLSAWSYILGFWLLGINPVAWQLFSVFLRWLAAWAVWKLLHQLWPNHLRQTFLSALFFLLYPAFVLQAQAISYFEVWISYIFLILSFYFSGRGIQEKHIGYHSLGFLSKVAHIFTSEYVTGLEFVRPFIIWYQLPSQEYGSLREKLIKVIRLWLPYLLINIGYIVWRVFIFVSPVKERTATRMLSGLLENPIETTQTLLLNLIQDLVLLLGTSWYSILTPSQFDFSRIINWVFFIIMALSAGLTWISLKTISVEKNKTLLNLPQNAIFLGFLFVLLGLAPYYAIGYFMHAKYAPWNGRVALGSLIGAGILISVLIHALIASRKKQNIVIALLVALLIGWQVRSANEFRYSWEKQLNFYQQLLWRIPELKENTAFISEQEILPFMGDYPTAFAINALYGQVTSIKDKNIPYWFFTTVGDFLGKEKELSEGILIGDEKHSLSFVGKSQESLILRFEPEQGQCLWILYPQDANSSLLNPTERLIAPLSAINRIENGQSTHLIQEIGGSPNSQNWCYFYQKAELARQFNQWDSVLQLWEQAQLNSQRPGNGFEYTPFIQAYAYTGDWETALALTNDANRLSRAMNWSLCPLWEDLRQNTPASSQKDKAFKALKERLKCSDFAVNP
jgi:hypothetical protein